MEFCWSRSDHFARAPWAGLHTFLRKKGCLLLRSVLSVNIPRPSDRPVPYGCPSNSDDHLACLAMPLFNHAYYLPP